MFHLLWNWKFRFRIHIPTYTGLIPEAFRLKLCMHFSSLRCTACYNHRFLTSLIRSSNNIWWRVKIMKLLIMQCFPVTYSFHKYTPQRSLLRNLNAHPVLLFFICPGSLPIGALCFRICFVFYVFQLSIWTCLPSNNFRIFKFQR